MAEIISLLPFKFHLAIPEDYVISPAHIKSGGLNLLYLLSVSRAQIIHALGPFALRSDHHAHILK